ncbi:MAG: hypothetical protein NXY57DRAFT_1033070 [Lentinula lateritia]|nr:MAG: hypothetical protein NXY57DRAFT_1033070 [Lentinula lateritia]
MFFIRIIIAALGVLLAWFSHQDEDGCGAFRFHRVCISVTLFSHWSSLKTGAMSTLYIWIHLLPLIYSSKLLEFSCTPDGQKPRDRENRGE